MFFKPKSITGQKIRVPFSWRNSSLTPLTPLTAFNTPERDIALNKGGNYNAWEIIDSAPYMQ
jgi:hypothetical protein